MASAAVGAVSIDYEEWGERDAPLVLLVAGLGDQRIAWPDDLVGQLVARGLRVVAFDNRDAGRSTVLDSPPVTGSTVAAAMRGEPVEPAYTLGDMAGDAVGLLDHLDAERAHIVGMSMGGMIAQRLAIGHPGRVASLVLVASTTGSRAVGQPTEEGRSVLFRAPPTNDRDAYVEDAVARRRIIGTHPLDEDEVRALARRAFDRGIHPQGTGRQLVAIHTDGDRTELLGAVAAPTLVVHGAPDPLIGVSGGRALAAAIPGARLVVVDGLGHDLPRPFRHRLAELIADHVHACA